MCKQQARVKELKELLNITYIQFTIISIRVRYAYHLISTGRTILIKELVMSTKFVHRYIDELSR